MSKSKTIASILASLAAVVLLAVAGYQLEWWLREDSINRTGEIRRNSFEVQETARDEVLRQAEQLARIDVDLADPELSSAQRTAITGQRRAAVVQMCNVASDITGSITPAVDAVILRNC